MSKTLESAIKGICARYGNDRTRMMDIVRAVQEQFGCVSSDAMDLIAREAGTQWYIVEQDTCPVDSIESAAVSAAFMARQ